MTTSGLEIHEFLKFVRERNIPVFDSRSESEFQQGHLPGAMNLPLLNNAEREEIGTIYKQKGRELAIQAGFRLVGPRFHEIILKAGELSPGKEVLLYCWRGGMRSQIISWLLQMNGFRVITLKGGYKSFRNWALDVINRPLNTIILGGPTGSGKTEILDQLRKMGSQVLQLEEIANHKGSAFGGLGKGNQPSNEQFENLISMEWSTFDASKPVWIENESRTIGSCMVPASLYALIRNSDLIEINVGDDRRKQRILAEYGLFPKDILADTTKKIAKRLGPQHLKQALILLQDGDMNGWLEIVLAYYDKLYSFGSTQRSVEKLHQLNLEKASPDEFADSVIRFANEKLSVKETSYKL